MSQGRYRILITDDFEVVRRSLRGILISTGITDIDEAADGKEALEKLRASSAAGEPFDLLITDWMMPNMNGLELIKACRFDVHFSGLPIIMFTSEGGLDEFVSATEAGANALLLKPISKEALREKLEELLPGLKTL